MEWLHQLIDWVVHFAYTPYGDWALFALAFAESSFFPIPPDVLMMALAAVRPSHSLWLATLTTIASVLGGAFGYWIGIKGGRPLLFRWFKAEKIKVVENFYQRWDVWAVGAAGLTPLPYKLFTISAGVFDLNFPRFMLASVISRGLRFFTVATFFYFFGPQIKSFVEEYFSLLTVAFFVLLIGGFWVVRHLGKRAAASGGGAP